MLVCGRSRFRLPASVRKRWLTRDPASGDRPGGGVVHSIRDQSDAPNLIVEQGKKLSSHVAELLFESALMESNPADVPRLYDALLEVYAHRADSKAALALLRRMQAAGVQMRRFHFSHAIRACVKEPKNAMDLFLRMKDAGFKPTIFVYHTVMRSLVNDTRLSGDTRFRHTKKMGMVESLREEMRENGLMPTIHTYGVLLYCYSKAGEVDKAEQLYAKLVSENIPMEATIINTMLQMRIEHGLNPMPLLESMHKFGLKPDPRTFSAIAKGCTITGNTGLAVKMFKELKNPDIEAWGSLLRCFVSARDVEGAERTFKEILDVGLQANGFVMTNMVMLYSNLHLESKVRMWVEKAMTMNLGKRAVQICRTLLIKTLARTGDCVAAENEFKKLWEENSADIVAVITIMNMYSKLKQADKVLDLFEQTKHRSDFGNRESLYNLVMDALCRTGEIERAKMFATELTSVVPKPSIFFYTQLVKIHGLEYNAKGIEQVVRVVRDAGLRPCTEFYNTLVVHQGLLGNFEDAEAYLEEARRNNLASRKVWTSLVRVYVKGMKLERAERAWDRMMAAGFRLDGRTRERLEQLRESRRSGGLSLI
uniref:PROP1-like PPR domain-containing protein n=1 Tax=Rhodosorus marinus TaxID=101924 RepID=A0A7S3ADC3_9RHOD|mmetsp:Transcript_9421/g.40825  ORF Transcript_9421/g.40825 Transcript_9421/m.40825 type:complete len:594 (+) Transcript_9421:265-2046(+)|eukprot:CAMPEP_0113966118 /NCGR_PEP_ID=MMETSP0011_2-20120614/8147_1 /TAXON_ID=101924 /ORGANISM="Rhodosorus marinus" /LENGTH=593 /DNA_ID=CAMNT_0000978755 /DNA_START=244 /DNA_END=2025 /DNA_ORIENTATION=+ /assembly_acc=CAM_ASM_000156